MSTFFLFLFHLNIIFLHELQSTLYTSSFPIKSCYYVSGTTWWPCFLYAIRTATMIAVVRELGMRLILFSNLIGTIRFWCLKLTTSPTNITKLCPSCIYFEERAWWWGYLCTGTCYFHADFCCFLIVTGVAESIWKFVPHKLTLPERELPPSIVLLSHQSGKLRLNNEALKLLETIKKPVAVLAICGPYRTGKSYFLSRFLGIPDAFEVGDTLDSCTHGIWMSTTVLECDEFMLLLLDTEGTEPVGETSSIVTPLLVMTSLLSSYLIYNTIGAPKKSELKEMR